VGLGGNAPSSVLLNPDRFRIPIRNSRGTRLKKDLASVRKYMLGVGLKGSESSLKIGNFDATKLTLNSGGGENLEG